MTDRIARMRQRLLEKQHHVHRQPLPEGDWPYRAGNLPDYWRTAQRLRLALELEQPVLLPEERIVLTRTVPNLPSIYDEAAWEDIRWEHFLHENGVVCNISPDYGATIASGLDARLGEVETARARYLQAGQQPQADYLAAMAQSIRAVLDLAARYAAQARAEGREEIARRLERVPAQGARTFADALQSLRFIHYALWCEGNYHNTLGRLDQLLWPYLEADLAAGQLDEEQAMELLEEFFLACNRDSDLYPGIQQGDNGQSVVLGGVNRRGEDAFNPLSRMCLEACGELRLIDPKINLRVSARTPLAVYELGTQLTKLGLGFPQYANDDVVIPALVKLGYALEDARDYVVAACWEFIIPGVGMDIPNIGAVSFAGAVDAAMREALPGAADMGPVLEAARRAVDRQVDALTASFANLYIVPSPFMSLLFEGCVARARDISLGSRYNNYGLHGTGLATAADSLAAMERAVFTEGKVTGAQLTGAVAENFAGQEALMQYLRYECPKMGNDEPSPDGYAVWLLDAFAQCLAGRRNERGGVYRAGTGSAMFYLWHARQTGATADGRCAQDPLPANYAPSLHTRLKGPVSVMRSFTKADLGKTINGGPLTLEFHDSVFRGEEAIAKVAALVQYFIARGGHQLQLNTVNRDRLLDAQQHPENHRNLIVRVWGWSGYFVELDKDYQDHIIARAELNLA